MSAQITFERRTVEQRAAYIEINGWRAYCATCKPDNRPLERWCHPDGECEVCGKDLQLSIELVDGMAEIEHIPVKIF